MNGATRVVVGSGLALVVVLVAFGGARLVTSSPSSDTAGGSNSPTTAAPSRTLTTAPNPSPSATPTPTAGPDATVGPVSDLQWATIVKTGTWRPGCPVGQADLRRVDINFRTFDGAVNRGQLIVHADSAVDIVEVFSALFRSGFPLERMEPVERFGGDVYRSLKANNTSAFNCRRASQINAPVKKSPHANGRAVDINPVQNPWKDPRCTCWVPSNRFARATEGAGVIRAGSDAIALFTARGWVWQNIKVPDYMHFDTGFPSQPRATPSPSGQSLPRRSSLPVTPSAAAGADSPGR